MLLRINIRFHCNNLIIINLKLDTLLNNLLKLYIFDSYLLLRFEIITKMRIFFHLTSLLCFLGLFLALVLFCMLGQLCFLFKAFVALVAFKRLVSSMNSKMINEITFLCEIFVTSSADQNGVQPTSVFVDFLDLIVLTSVDHLHLWSGLNNIYFMNHIELLSSHFNHPFPINSRFLIFHI